MKSELENTIPMTVSVRSLDPSISTAKLAAYIEGSQGMLLSVIETQGAESASISRNLTFPIPGGDVALEILVGLATGAAEEVGKEITKAVLAWLRENWPNARIELVQLNLSDHSERKD